MALNDGLRTPHRDGVGDTRKGTSMLPAILGVLAVLALAWWFFGDRLMPSNATRTSTPVTGSPTSGASNTTNTSTPGTAKQP